MELSEYTRKLLLASYVRGIGRGLLRMLSRDPLFFQLKVDQLYEHYPEFRSLVPGTLIYDKILVNVDRTITEANIAGHYIISVKDSWYPRFLRDTVDSPVVLYVSGDPRYLSDKAIAIVGTREPSVNGRRTAEKITSFFANNGWLIVSGLASGIDTVSHKTAVVNQAKTLAVVAHGLDTIYPKENRQLAEEIIKGGGFIVSEYPYKSRIFPSNFVERDRIQAGISRGVVMVQSDERGGSLYASRAALKYNRLLIVPEPTKMDTLAQHPKIVANDLILNMPAIEKANYLQCTIDQLSNVIPLRGKEDYRRIEDKLLSLRLSSVTISGDAYSQEQERSQP